MFVAIPSFVVVSLEIKILIGVSSTTHPINRRRRREPFELEKPRHDSTTRFHQPTTFVPRLTCVTRTYPHTTTTADFSDSLRDTFIAKDVIARTRLFFRIQRPLEGINDAVDGNTADCIRRPAATATPRRRIFTGNERAMMVRPKRV